MSTRVKAMVGVTAVGMALYLFRVCWFYEWNTSVEALAGPDRAYIIVGLRTSGGSLGVGGVLLCAVGGYFAPGGQCSGRPLRDDLLVVEVTADTVASHRLTNFGSGGRPYVSDGVLRYGRAGFRGSAGAVWQWTGYDFEAMATPNPELIKDESSTAEVGRWTEKDDWSPSVGDSFEFELHGTKLVVTVEGFLNRGATSTPASLRVRLRGHQVEGTTTLVESDPAERWFHWREYGELASYGPAPAAPPWIERLGV